MLGFIKKALTKIYSQVTGQIRSLFSRTTIDATTLSELETILIRADTGVQTTRIIIDNLKKTASQGRLTTGSELEQALMQELKRLLTVHSYNPEADVYLLVGINGSGKTTFASKLGFWLKQQNKRVLFVAADTFRAAATEQLTSWAQRLDIPIVSGAENQDPASVIFQGCEEFKTGKYDTLIIDTAGRLQTKVNLMRELEKIRKIIEKQLGQKKVSTLLTIDAMLGQNSFDQAKIFNESTQVNGIVLTKMDGTGKGGIVFSITQELKIPIAFISYGEQPDQLALFDANQYVTDLIGE